MRWQKKWGWKTGIEKVSAAEHRSCHDGSRMQRSRDRESFDRSGQTLVTPLQIARMTAIVASDGVDHGAHILLSEKTGKRRILSKDTARQIRSMMCLVTEEGTAQNMGLVDPDGSAAAAVKTGTAQYGRQEDGNSYGWLTGFTPCKNPEYIVTVFAGGSGTRTASDAGPLYRRIVKYLNRHYD